MDAKLDTLITSGPFDESVKQDFKLLTQFTESGAMWNPEYRLPLSVNGMGLAVETSVEFIFKQLVDPKVSVHVGDFVEDEEIDVQGSEVSSVSSDDEMDATAEFLRIESPTEIRLGRSSEMPSLGVDPVNSSIMEGMESVGTFSVEITN